jgi:hypothetical protein
MKKIKEYRLKFAEIFSKFQFESANKKTLNNVNCDVCDYLYENGYDDKSFKPLIPNINYKLSVEYINKIPFLQLELLDDGEWYVFN